QTVKAVASIAATDNDGDTVILARNLPIATVVTRLFLPKTVSITAGSDYDIGFYKVGREDGDDLGEVIDKDALADGLDADTGLAVGDVLGANISPFDETKTIAELLGIEDDQAYAGGVHLVLTLNTAGTAAGTVDMDISLAMAG
ncbi:MAG: hypothetical protein U9O65_02775, partial [Thermotogota bacterium]|nr:hypothetical protein [Thermotogota bacterium]